MKERLPAFGRKQPADIDDDDRPFYDQAMSAVRHREGEIERLEAELADLRRYSVQVWEKCETCDDGLMCPLGIPHDHDDGCRCPGCGGSGLQLKDGVRLMSQHPDFGWYEPDYEDAHVATHVMFPAEMVEGTG